MRMLDGVLRVTNPRSASGASPRHTPVANSGLASSPKPPSFHCRAFATEVGNAHWGIIWPGGQLGSARLLRRVCVRIRPLEIVTGRLQGERGGLEGGPCCGQSESAEVTEPRERPERPGTVIHPSDVETTGQPALRILVTRLWPFSRG